MIPENIIKFLTSEMKFISEYETNQEARKDEIRVKWHESTNYPRKKKKQIRKELILDWSIACWKPFF